MARLFGASTEKIVCGSASVFDDVTELTLTAWIYPTSVGSDDHILSKKASSFTQGMSWNLNDPGSGDRIYFAKDLATTDVFLDSVDGTITLNAWQFVAVSWSTTAGKLYRATPGNRVTEVSYSTQQPGAGSPSPSDAAADVILGQRGSDTNPLTGRMADFRWYDARIEDLDELTAIMMGLRGIRESNLIARWPLWGLDSPEPDLSGSGNNGTVTGATRVDNPPTTLFSRKWPDSPLLETAAPAGFAHTQAVIIA